MANLQQLREVVYLSDALGLKDEDWLLNSNNDRKPCLHDPVEIYVENMREKARIAFLADNKIKKVTVGGLPFIVSRPIENMYYVSVHNDRDTDVWDRIGYNNTYEWYVDGERSTSMRIIEEYIECVFQLVKFVEECAGGE